MSALTTGEILEKVSDSGIAKAEGKTLRLLIWALLAGAYIAFGAQASQMVSFNLLADPASLGVGRLVSAAVFPVGLMMVVLCGAELFTGNGLMIIGVLDRKIRISGMLRNWVLVYLGNFLGLILYSKSIHRMVDFLQKVCYNEARKVLKRRKSTKNFKKKEVQSI